jgi:hypothetical protein
MGTPLEPACCGVSVAVLAMVTPLVPVHTMKLPMEMV